MNRLLPPEMQALAGVLRAPVTQFLQSFCGTNDPSV